MMKKHLSMEDAIRFGWEVTKSNLLFFIGLLLVVAIVEAIPSWIQVSSEDAGADLLVSILSIAIHVLVSLGLTRIALRFADKDKGEFSDLYSAYPLFFNFLFASFLYGLMVGLGLLLLIVPGIILAVTFQFYSYAIVDRGLGPIASLKRSAELTRGVRWDLFLFGLLLFAINLLGALALLIGLFLTVPTTMIALAHAYRQLDRQTSPAPAAELAPQP